MTRPGLCVLVTLGRLPRWRRCYRWQPLALALKKQGPQDRDQYQNTEYDYHVLHYNVHNYNCNALPLRTSMS